MTDDGVDPRFSLANERTFLAWIRTALGLLAAAAGLLALHVPWPERAVHAVALLLTVVGGFSAVLGWDRWRRVQRALERGTELPSPRANVVLPAAVLVVAVTIAVLTVL
jgi:putative membrane protein